MEVWEMNECGSCGQFHPKGFDGDCRDDANRLTLVVFRRWGNGDIIALFPTFRDRTYCESFEHVGQHGLAYYSGVISMTKPALPEEYAALKRELESAPYHYVLRVIKRYTRGREGR
jgi:hypothetical protein